MPRRCSGDRPRPRPLRSVVKYASVFIMKEPSHQEVNFGPDVFLGNRFQRVLVSGSDVRQRIVAKMPAGLWRIFRAAKSPERQIVETPPMQMGDLDSGPFRSAQGIEETPGRRRQALIEGREENL